MLSLGHETYNTIQEQALGGGGEDIGWRSILGRGILEGGGG